GASIFPRWARRRSRRTRIASRSRARSTSAPAVEERLRRRLLRGPLRGGRAGFWLEALEHDAHDEMGSVRRAAALDLFVAGGLKRARLGPLLHRGLGVAGGL